MAVLTDVMPVPHGNRRRRVVVGQRGPARRPGVAPRGADIRFRSA